MGLVELSLQILHFKPHLHDLLVLLSTILAFLPLFFAVGCLLQRLPFIFCLSSVLVGFDGRV